MARRAHLVGTWPGRGPEHAMETALRKLAPHLDRMTDGETGDRSLWVTPAMEKFRANPDVEMVRDGDWSAYDRLATWKLADGKTLDPDNIRLHYALAFENSYPSFVILRDRYGRSDLRFQVGIPAPIDLAVYAFGEAAFADPGIVAACTEATVREIRKVADRAGEDVVFQIETVVGLIAVAQGAENQDATVAQMAATITDVAARSPEGTHFGTHLCLGDFNHEAYGNTTDARPLVLLANAIAAEWPAGRQLDYVHVPFAAAAEPPMPDESFYAPLSDLRLPGDTRLIAGFLHNKLDTDAHRRLLDRIERFVGHEVDIAASCGLGRRKSDDEAFEQMRETANLLES